MTGNLTAGPVNQPPAPAAAPATRAATRSTHAPGSTGGPPRREVTGQRLLGLPLWQVVTIETLLAGPAVAGATRNQPLILVAGVLALLGTGLVLARHRHRPLLAWLAVRWRYRRRGRRRAGSDGGDHRLAPLREVLPALSLDTISLRDGHRLAVCFDGTGWSSVIALHRDNDLLPGQLAAPRLPLSVLRQVLQVDDIALSSVQVLVQTMPAPDGRLPDAAPAAVSYRQLGGPQTPATRQTFVVLRIDPTTGRSAIDARGGGTQGAQRALKRCTNRLVELLEAASVPARPLAEDPWLAAMGDVAGTSQSPTGPAADAPRTGETRQAFHPGHDGVHVTWWVRDWPDDAAPLLTLADLCSQLPAGTAHLSFTLYPGAADTLRCRALIRLATRTAEASQTAAAALITQAQTVRARLVRLDGEQGPAYLSTILLGGGTL